MAVLTQMPVFLGTHSRTWSHINERAQTASSNRLTHQRPSEGGGSCEALGRTGGHPVHKVRVGQFYELLESIEKMEEFDDVQTVYTNMKPEE